MTPSRSVLGQLRDLMPSYPLRFREALVLAETQSRLLPKLLKAEPGALDERHLRRLPYIRVVRANLPVSGVSHWSGAEWVIALAVTDSPAQRRFALLYELKRIIDHGFTDLMYTGTAHRTPRWQAEAACDFFAACTLIPRTLLVDALSAGLSSDEELALRFDVSVQRIRMRRQQTGLTTRVVSLLQDTGGPPEATPSSNEFRRAAEDTADADQGRVA